MKVNKFVFKLIDHDAKTCKIFEFEAHCEKLAEWTEKRDASNIKGHSEWMLKDLAWNYALKDAIINELKKKLDKDTLESYVMTRKKVKKEEGMINMNSAKGPSNDINFREIYSMQVCIFKYTKGKHSENWTDMYNYKKTHLKLLYNMNCDENKPHEINLEEVRFIDSDKSAGNEVREMNEKTISQNDTVMKGFNVPKDYVFGLKKNPTTQQTQQTQQPQQISLPSLTQEQMTLANQIINQNFKPVPQNIHRQQGGNEDSYDKYMKYKMKYEQLKKQVGK
jgi:hypothetical protein